MSWRGTDFVARDGREYRAFRSFVDGRERTVLRQAGTRDGNELTMKTDPGAGLPEGIALDGRRDFSRRRGVHGPSTDRTGVRGAIAFVGSEPGGVLRTGDSAATLGLTTFDDEK